MKNKLVVVAGMIMVISIRLSGATPGDVDGDGIVTLQDLAMLKQLLASDLLAAEIPAIENADVNLDNLVNAVDIVALDWLLPPFSAGDLFEADPILGNLRFVPAGHFIQGSPPEEPCRVAGDEIQFRHLLPRHLAVMETEVTRRMWFNLKSIQPTLPADPTDLTHGSGQDNPVQQVTWFEALLFANLLSLQHGLERCYFKDAALTIPLDATNHEAEPYFCDWDATGYRLPSEGEWEYFARAETTTPFWIEEPGYTESNCSVNSTPGMYSSLETAAWFWGNSSSLDASSPVGVKAANPWKLLDVLGNVWEWNWDWHQSAYPTGEIIDYHGPSSGTARVLRGNSWHGSGRYCRSAFRRFIQPGSRSYATGFRLVRTIAFP